MASLERLLAVVASLPQTDLEHAERFEREMPPVELDPALRAQLSDLGKRLPELWDGGRLSAEHKKELLRSLIRRAVLLRPKSDSTEIRMVWISGAVSPLSVRRPVTSKHDRGIYTVRFLAGGIASLAQATLRYQLYGAPWLWQIAERVAPATRHPKRKSDRALCHAHDTLMTRSDGTFRA